MDNTITKPIARTVTTERVQLLVDILPEDEEKLTILTEGSKVPKGILYANLVYLQTLKSQPTPQTTPVA